jgi:molecular chaperone GrpE
MADGDRNQRPAGAPEDWDERAPAGTPSAAEPQPADDPVGTGREAEEPTGDGSEVADDLDALLVDVRRERDEYLALAQRAKADFENYRKRTARDAAEAERRGKASLARDLMPSLDSLERALRSAGVEPGGESPQPHPAGEPAGPGREAEEPTGSDSLARGVALVYRELRTTLERAGVEAFDPAGEQFDPVTSEALHTRTEDGVEPGTILETVERGYRLDGQVLRPARVIVAG